MTNIANWKITIFDGKIHYFCGHFPVHYVCLPEGTIQRTSCLREFGVQPLHSAPDHALVPAPWQSHQSLSQYHPIPMIHSKTMLNVKICTTALRSSVSQHVSTSPGHWPFRSSQMQHIAALCWSLNSLPSTLHSASSSWSCAAVSSAA